MRGIRLLLLAALAVGCSDGAEPTTPAMETVEAPAAAATHGDHPSDARRGPDDGGWQIELLRLATLPFHDFALAGKLGWGTKLTECFSDRAGGMGYHYGNTALLDGKVEPLRPEIALYEPQKDGTLRFVAVEYAVPFTAWTKSEPPSVFGQPFHRNEQFQLWVLHVWHVQKNPRGTFSDWNPTVRCR